MVPEGIPRALRQAVDGLCPPAPFCDEGVPRVPVQICNQNKALKPYHVFPNQTLKDLASIMPTTVQQFVEIHGVCVCVCVCVVCVCVCVCVVCVCVCVCVVCVCVCVCVLCVCCVVCVLCVHAWLCVCP